MTALLLRSLARARFVLIGTAILLCAFQILIIAQAVEVQRSNAFSSVANLVPAFLQRGLGNRAMLLATFKGMVAFGYFHPVVCLLIALVAAYLTTEIAHEVEAGLLDLELARAVPRRRLLTRSLLLVHAALIVFVVVMAAGTWLGIRLFDAADLDVPSPRLRAELLLNVFALASVFGALGLAVASGARRWSAAFTVVVLAAVVSYIIDFLALGWTPLQSVAWLTPFHYYPALYVLSGEADTPRNLTVLVASSAVLTAGAYWQFQRRDL